MADESITEIKTTRALNWFPGHMMKAMKKIKEHVRSVDIVLEIRDARSPLATGNESFTKQIGDKSRLIVMNKANLSDPKMVDLWSKWFSKQGEPFVFINSFDKESLNQIVKQSKEIVLTKHLKSNPGTTLNRKLRMMIIGLPNTGKSTIINRLSNRDASKVADRPGQTQQHLWVNVSSELEMLDTPGVMPPVVETEEQVLWLSALHAIPEKIMDQQNTACYIVEHLLKNNPKALSSHYKISEDKSSMIETLDQIAKVRGCLLRKNEYDYDRVYKLLINDFRAGLLGLVNFGFPPKE